MKFYNRQGEPIGIHDWVILNSDDTQILVCQHDVQGYLVTTVYTGIDRSFGRASAPLIFETLVIPPEIDDASIYQAHHPTEDAAMAGHDQAMAWLREKLRQVTRKCEACGAKVTGTPELLVCAQCGQVAR